MDNLIPHLTLPTRVNQRWQYSGIDSRDWCINQTWFEQYPYTVEYIYNSRGFRDEEWPDSLSTLRQAIWCIGDSFTVGIGQPFSHIWPQVLSKQTNRRTINVSLDGASNNWIARRTLDIITAINPTTVVVMWSYLERREDDLWQKFYADIRDSSWPDCDRIDDIGLLPQHIQSEIINLHKFDLNWFRNDENFRNQTVQASDLDNFLNWQQCIDSVRDYSQIIHLVIPNFARSSILKDKCWTYLANNTKNHIAQFQNLDMARDYHHFDILTSKWVVARICDLIT